MPRRLVRLSLLLVLKDGSHSSVLTGIKVLGIVGFLTRHEIFNHLIVVTEKKIFKECLKRRWNVRIKEPLLTFRLFLLKKFF